MKAESLVLDIANAVSSHLIEIKMLRDTVSSLTQENDELRQQVIACGLDHPKKIMSARHAIRAKRQTCHTCKAPMTLACIYHPWIVDIRPTESGHKKKSITKP